MSRLVAYCGAMGFLASFVVAPALAGEQPREPDTAAWGAGIGAGMYGLRLRHCENGKKRELSASMIAEARSLVAPYEVLRLGFQEGYERQRRLDLGMLGEEYLDALKCGKLEDELSEVVERLHQAVSEYELEQLGK